MAGEGVLSKPCGVAAPPPLKKKRNLPGTPDPEAEVIALSPRTLLATNRFLCEICGKGFQRDQNLQLHRRGHNLPWKLKQRSGKEPRKRVYVCPEPSCVHHNPSRALGDLTGIKKHFCRKHGEKKWKCDRCSKRYAVQSDWKAHSKTCGTREYRCDCGVIFSRRDSFITHRAFCDALAEESARVSASYKMTNVTDYLLPSFYKPNMIDSNGGGQGLSLWMGINPHEPVVSAATSLMYGDLAVGLTSSAAAANQTPLLGSVPSSSLFTSLNQRPAAAPDMSATALLQKAAQVGVTTTIPFDGRSKFEGLFLPNQAGNGSAVADDELAAVSSRTASMRRDYLGGETRDFLGVGVQALRRPSVNGWI